MEIKWIMTAILFAIVGIGLGGSLISDFGFRQQTVQAVTNETVALSGFNTTKNIANQRILATTFTLKNQTDGVALINGMEYSLSSDLGYIRTNNRTGNYYASYNYYPLAYVSGISGSLIGFIPAIFFVGILAVFALMWWKSE